MTLPVNCENFNVRAFIRDHFFRGPVEWEYEFDAVMTILNMARRSFCRQPALLEVCSPLNICGDLHGQYKDLLKIFQENGLPFNTRYLFLGDYVDRGRYSLETMILLLACKIEYPENVYLIRGNHEIPSVNKTYGFWAEIRMRFHKSKQWDKVFTKFSAVFAQMPVAATVNRKILCMHGGLSPSLNSLEDLKKISRPILEPEGLLEDILWSDPAEETEKFAKNEDRGCSFTFGADAVEEMCQKLGVNMIVRAHQVVDGGYEFFANRRVVTIFSAAGYNDQFENLGAVMKISREGSISFFQFDGANAMTRNPRLARTICTE